MNTTIVIGRLGNDPDLRYTNGGTAVATFRIAVRNPRDDNKPYWVPVKAFGKMAEALVQHLGKGDEAGITGSLESSEWDDNDGGRHFKLEVVARTIDFLRKRRNADDPDSISDDTTP